MSSHFDRTAFIETIAVHFDLIPSELGTGSTFSGDGFDSLMLYELFDLFEELVGRPVAPGALEEVNGIDDLFAMYRDVTSTSHRT
jgi:acyl carrier protein